MGKKQVDMEKLVWEVEGLVGREKNVKRIR